MLCIRNSWKFDYRILLFMKVELLNEESKITPRLRKLSIYCIGKPDYTNRYSNCTKITTYNSKIVDYLLLYFQ